MKFTNRISGLTVLAVFILYAEPSDAKIWRINSGSNFNGTSLMGSNFGGTFSYPVFKEIDQAVTWIEVNDLPGDRDTLHVEGSPIVYAECHITKNLVIIGPGYYLGDNPKTSNDLFDAKVSRINFWAGSGGSMVAGINIVANFWSSDGYIEVAADSITIKRCRIEKTIVYTVDGLDLAVVVQNFFPDGFGQTNAMNGFWSSFVPPVEVYFNNNICRRTFLWITGAGLPGNITQCRNNVFDGPDNLSTPSLTFSTTDFSNNILMPVNAVVNITAAPQNIAYNIGSLAGQFGTSYNNLVEPNIALLFTGGSSTDGYYQIQTGSQASQNGSDGTDRGAFGGLIVSSRYTLSGLAPVPVIYEATTTGIVDPATGLPVTIKARTIK